MMTDQPMTGTAERARQRLVYGDTSRNTWPHTAAPTDPVARDLVAATTQATRRNR